MFCCHFQIGDNSTLLFTEVVEAGVGVLVSIILKNVPTILPPSCLSSIRLYSTYLMGNQCTVMMATLNSTD